MAKRRKRLSRSGISKRWAADSVQIKSKTRHKSFGASVMKGATRESGAGAASYRRHMNSAGQIKENPETGVVYAHSMPIPYTQLSLERWLNMPKYVDKFGKEQKKLPLVEVLKRIAELQTLNTPGGAEVTVQHEAGKHTVITDAYGRPEPFVNKFKSPRDNRLGALKERANQYFNMTQGMTPDDPDVLPSRQTVDRWPRKKVYDNGRDEIIWLYMNGERHFFLRLREGELARSITYVGRQRALKVLEQWRITWQEKLSI